MMESLWDNPYPPSAKTARFTYPEHLMPWYARIVRPAVFQYTDRASWEARGRGIREHLRVALGHRVWPSELPLEAHLVGLIRKESYCIRRVVYQVWPGTYSTGYLYLPDQISGKAPAILCPHGHWSHGAADPVVQSRCIGLARKGYVVLTVDTVHGSDTLAGMVDIGVMTWNNIRAIDVLCSLPEVAVESIGCTGASGGSLQTQFLMAVEPRLKVAVPVCNVSRSRYIIYPSDEAYCGCNFVPSLLQYSDYPEVCALFAPRPALYICATGDWTRPFPKDGFPQIEDVYRLYQAQDQVSCIQFDCEHAYNRPMREQAYAFFNRHLRGVDDPGEATEPPCATLHPDELREALEVPPEYCTLLRDPARSRQNLSRHVRGKIAPQRVPLSTTEAQDFVRSVRARLADMLHEEFGARPASGLRVMITDVESAAHGDMQELSLESEADLWVPATLFVPALQPEAGLPAIIVTCPEGRRYFRRQQPDRVWRLVAQGFAVMLVDIRLMGDMGGVDWVQNQQIMGRWEMGMGARDLHAAVQYLRDRPGIDARRISCLARGETGLAGMVLAALSGGLLALALDDVGMTYRSGRQEPAVFNLLSCGDLPEIMSAARVPNLYINAAVAEPYEIVRRIRALLGVTGQVELHSTAAFLACEQGLGWIVREGRDDGSWQVAPCSQSPRVVLRNASRADICAPLAIRPPDDAAFPPYGLLQAVDAADDARPFVRSEEGIRFLAAIPAGKTVEYRVVPGDRIDGWPASACEIHTAVWPDGFRLEINGMKVYVGLSSDACAAAHDPRSSAVTWLNLAGVRRDANPVFGRHVFQYIDKEVELLLTVTSSAGGIVDLDLDAVGRADQRVAELGVVYRFQPAGQNGIPRYMVEGCGLGGPSVKAGPPGADVWVRCRGGTTRLYSAAGASCHGAEGLAETAAVAFPVVLVVRHEAMVDIVLSAKVP